MPRGPNEQHEWLHLTCVYTFLSSAAPFETIGLLWPGGERGLSFGGYGGIFRRKEK